MNDIKINYKEYSNAFLTAIFFVTSKNKKFYQYNSSFSFVNDELMSCKFDTDQIVSVNDLSDDTSVISNNIKKLYSN